MQITSRNISLIALCASLLIAAPSVASDQPAAPDKKWSTDRKVIVCATGGLLAYGGFKLASYIDHSLGISRSVYFAVSSHDTLAMEAFSLNHEVREKLAQAFEMYKKKDDLDDAQKKNFLSSIATEYFARNFGSQSGDTPFTTLCDDLKEYLDRLARYHHAVKNKEIHADLVESAQVLQHLLALIYITDGYAAEANTITNRRHARLALLRIFSPF